MLSVRPGSPRQEVYTQFLLPVQACGGAQGKSPACSAARPLPSETGWSWAQGLVAGISSQLGTPFLANALAIALVPLCAWEACWGREQWPYVVLVRSGLVLVVRNLVGISRQTLEALGETQGFGALVVDMVGQDLDQTDNLISLPPELLPFPF